MASAPKKPRTGNPTVVEEPPDVEQKPVNDGDAPAEEPRPEEESSSDVPLVRRPPRLRMKARKCVQLHMAQLHMASDEIVTDEDDHPAEVDEEEDLPVQGEVEDFTEEVGETPAARVLLVNRRWLDAFFDPADFGLAQIFFPPRATMLGKAYRPVALFAMTSAGVGSLLRLSRNLTEIGVLGGCTPPGNFAAAQRWVRVASLLRTLPNLTAIHLLAARVTHTEANFLVDSLPDRVTRLITDSPRIATMLRKRQTPLESVEIVPTARQHSYLADVFRLNSACITLCWQPKEEPSCLHLQHDYGPFDRNEHLQELHIQDKSCAKDDLPRALRHLRAVNEHFKLICHGAYDVRLKKSLDLERVGKIADQAKEFAAEMRKAGFCSDGDELRISLEDAEKWRHVSHELVFERLNWTSEGEIPWLEYSKSLPTCSFVQDGVRILIGLKRPC